MTCPDGKNRAMGAGKTKSSKPDRVCRPREDPGHAI